ncbi:unnamed protein product [Cutaneotrichosporon oleaginosum]
MFKIAARVANAVGTSSMMALFMAAKLKTMFHVLVSEVSEEVIVRPGGAGSIWSLVSVRAPYDVMSRPNTKVVAKVVGLEGPRASRTEAKKKGGELAKSRRDLEVPVGVEECTEICREEVAGLIRMAIGYQVMGVFPKVQRGSRNESVTNVVELGCEWGHKLDVRTVTNPAASVKHMGLGHYARPTPVVNSSPLFATTVDDAADGDTKIRQELKEGASDPLNVTLDLCLHIRTTMCQIPSILLSSGSNAASPPSWSLICEGPDPVGVLLSAMAAIPRPECDR